MEWNEIITKKAETVTLEDLKHDIQYHREMMQQYLWNVKYGIDQTGNLEFHLNKMKDAFESMETMEMEERLKGQDAESEAQEKAGYDKAMKFVGKDQTKDKSILDDIIK